MELAYDAETGLAEGEGVPVDALIIEGSSDPGWKPWLGADAKPAAYRRVPLLRVADDTIAVGAIQIVMAPDGNVRLRVGVEREQWKLANGEWRPFTVDDPQAFAKTLGAWWETEYGGPKEDTPQARATALAKALAERSRDHVRRLRAARAVVEGRLSDALREESDVPDRGTLAALRTLLRLGAAEARNSAPRAKDQLATLIELARAANRAREQCLEGVRQGTALWRTDGPTYHLHRRLVDPTLLRPKDEPDPATAPQPVWLRQHDAGIRQLGSAAEQLGEEVDQIYGLLDGASTIAAIRDAEAQEQLNTVAAVAAVGLGIPGLILALFGADVLVPFSEGGRQAAVLGLIFLVTLVVLLFVLAQMRQSSARSGRTMATALGVATLLALTLFLVSSLNPTEDRTVFECAPRDGGPVLTCRAP